MKIEVSTEYMLKASTLSICQKNQRKTSSNMLKSYKEMVEFVSVFEVRIHKNTSGQTRLKISKQKMQKHLKFENEN